MKKVFLFLVVLTICSCTSNEEIEIIEEATVVGRWNLDGFLGSVLYEFTEDKRYTFYSSDGNFQSIQELLDEGRSGSDWWLEEDDIIIDLNFGNLSTLTPTFKCSNNVIVWTNGLNEVHSTYYREGYNLSDCNE
jgi:hypothetical protein